MSTTKKVGDKLIKETDFFSLADTIAYKVFEKDGVKFYIHIPCEKISEDKNRWKMRDVVVPYETPDKKFRQIVIQKEQSSVQAIINAIVKQESRKK